MVQHWNWTVAVLFMPYQWGFISSAFLVLSADKLCSITTNYTEALSRICACLFWYEVLTKDSRLPVSVCSRGGARVRGRGGLLGESRPTRLGLWREAWLDLQQQPGRRADPARPTGGLNAAHTQAHSPTCGELRETGQRERWMCHSERRKTGDGIVRDTARYSDKDAELSDWRQTSDARGKKSDSKKLRAKPDGEKQKDRNCIPLEGRPIKDQELFRWLIYFFVVVKYYFIWMYLFKRKKFVFYIIYALGWEILFIFCCFVLLCSTQVWRLAIVCVKFCNNIKRRYGRANKNPIWMSFFPSFMCSVGWMIAVVNFPSLVQTHRYFWQAFDVALRWAVPLQWPLNGVNTPFTVQFEAAALCSIEYMMAHHFTQNALLLWEHCWPTGPNLLGQVEQLH